MRNTVCVLGLRLTHKFRTLFGDIFMTLYLWDLSQGDIALVASYNFAFFLCTLAGMWSTTPFFSKSRKRKAVIVAGCAGQLLFFAIMLCLGASCVSYAVPLGAIHGFSVGCYYSVYNLYEVEGIDNGSRRKVIGVYQSVSGLVSILFPVISGWLIYSCGMQYCVFCVIAATGLSVLFASFYKDDGVSLGSRFSLKGLFAELKSNERSRRGFGLYAASDFLRGITISYGAFDVFLSVYNIRILQTSLSIGAATALCNVVSICFSLAFAKWAKRMGHRVTSLHCVLWWAVALSVAALAITGSPAMLGITMVSYRLALSVDSCVYSSASGNFLGSPGIAPYKPEIDGSLLEFVLTVARAIGFGAFLSCGLIGDVMFVPCSLLFGLSFLLLPVVQGRFYRQQFLQG